MEGKITRVAEQCPLSRQTVYYPLARCDLNDKPCVLEEGMECPTYEDWLFEQRQEELDCKGSWEDSMTEKQEEEVNDLFDRAFNLARKGSVDEKT